MTKQRKPKVDKYSVFEPMIEESYLDFDALVKVSYLPRFAQSQEGKKETTAEKESFLLEPIEDQED